MCVCVFCVINLFILPHTDPTEVKGSPTMTGYACLGRIWILCKILPPLLRQRSLRAHVAG